MGSYYPRTLQFFMKELSSYSRQKYKLSCNISQSQTLQAGNTLIVPLPQNSIVDLDTLVWYFKGYTNGAGVGFPQHVETIIQSLAFEVNGQMIDNVREFPTLWRRLADFTMGADKAFSRNVLCSGAQWTSASLSNATTHTSSTQFAVYNWGLGFLATAQPRCIDTSLLGDCRIHITLAPNSVLPKSSWGAGVSSPSYTITDNYFCVDCLTLDPLYYELVNKRLASSEMPIQIPFQTFTVFSQGTCSLDQTTTGTIATGSLDCLVGTYKDSNWSLGTLNSNVASSCYFKTGSSNLGSSRFSINNIEFPAFKQVPANAFVGTLQALGVANDANGGSDTNCQSLSAYTNDFFFHMLRLNHPTGTDERVRSGLNLRGTNSTISFTTEASTAEAGITPYLYAGHTSVLEIKPFKQIQLVR